MRKSGSNSNYLVKSGKREVDHSSAVQYATQTASYFVALFLFLFFSLSVGKLIFGRMSIRTKFGLSRNMATARTGIKKSIHK